MHHYSSHPPDPRDDHHHPLEHHVVSKQHEEKCQRNVTLFKKIFIASLDPDYSESLLLILIIIRCNHLLLVLCFL